MFGNPLSFNVLTRISKFLSITILVVTFLGILPNFKNFVSLIPLNFLSFFPKVWVLLTASFQTNSIFSALFSCIYIIFCAFLIEPNWGSKEFLRYILITGFYSNLIILFFSFFMYFVTGEVLIIFKIFETSNSLTAALNIAIAYLYMDDPASFCNCIKIRHFPFYSFLFSAFFAVLSMRCDSYLSGFLGAAIGYYYIRYIKRHTRTGVRGDPNFDYKKLIPYFDNAAHENLTANQNFGNNFAHNFNHRNNLNENNFGFNAHELNNQPTRTNTNNAFRGTPHRLDEI
ncbi:hypothetical protein TRFO_27931 [Tritrichomonas foetus]|uniref:Peptidase S54 rhomboid domain-containing protein n=1 Tax=Tritrichomonas foetus TaxID=1144522 RepID=A0A1J4K4D7_9EUKA|nr:hypothetical protein TRFO_27931 [Tritrichomonas foetus]|eukprot:OHT04550.1 hypothetical protein TRFO_27931 [Tritrichomonas foetus]